MGLGLALPVSTNLSLNKPLFAVAQFTWRTSIHSRLQWECLQREIVTKSSKRTQIGFGINVCISEIINNSFSLLLYSLYSFTDLMILQFIDSMTYFVSHFKESFEPDIFGLQWMVVILPGQPGIPVPICVAMELNVVTENAPILHLLIMAKGVSEILPKHEVALTSLVQVGDHITLFFYKQTEQTSTLLTILALYLHLH